MKKQLYLLVVPILWAIVMGSCTSMDCSHEPYYFTIVVKKGSPEYSLFLKDSLIDKEVIDEDEFLRQVKGVDQDC